MDTKTLLIVDDEPDILRIIERSLTQEGFQVKTARNAEVAYQQFSAMSPRPDLVIADVVMPGLSGPMLAERLRELDPALRVLFISGYDSTNVVRRYVVDRGFSLLPKPFTVAGLKQAVKAALEMPRVVSQECGP